MWDGVENLGSIWSCCTSIHIEIVTSPNGCYKRARNKCLSCILHYGKVFKNGYSCIKPPGNINWVHQVQSTSKKWSENRYKGSKKFQSSLSLQTKTISWWASGCIISSRTLGCKNLSRTIGEQGRGHVTQIDPTVQRRWKITLTFHDEAKEFGAVPVDPTESTIAVADS